MHQYDIKNISLQHSSFCCVGLQGHSTYCTTSHFLQVTRPDGKTDSLLGKTVLDEPKTNQSDPNVLDLQLRAIAKQPNIKPVVSYVLHQCMLPYCTFMHMRIYNIHVCILTVFGPTPLIHFNSFTCIHFHKCYCMCAACEQISSEHLHAYGLQMHVLYFILFYLQVIYNSG